MAYENKTAQTTGKPLDEGAFGMLVERLPAVTYVVELGEPSVVKYVSPQVEQLTGFTQEEWLADQELWRRQIHPEDRERVLAEVREKNASGTPFALDHRLLTKDGQSIWVRNESQYELDTEGRPRIVFGLLRDVSRRKRAEDEATQVAHQLNERVKELSCLFGIASLVEHSRASLEELLQNIVELIPPSWEYPEAACARLDFEGREYTTRNFEKTSLCMCAEVHVHGQNAGCLEVCYLEGRLPPREAPFVKEERMLLNVVAARIGRIVERFRAETALSEAQQRFADLVNSVNVGVYRNTPGPEGHFLEANSKIIEMFEASSKEEFLRHNVSDLYQDPEQRRAFSDKMIREGTVNAEELELHTLKGRPFWAAVTAIRREDDKGNTYFDGIVEDISDGKEAEQQLMLQSTALASAANGIVITDTEGTILWVNPAFSTLTGYSEEEAVGQHTRLLKSGRHAASFYEEMWDTIKAGKVWRGELVNKRKDGTLYDEDMTITPVRADAGEIVNYIAIKQDIAERKKAEAQIVAYGEQLEHRAAEMQSDLDMAREVQQALLPQQYPSFPASVPHEESALRFCHLYHPSGAVGGDYFDILPLSEHTVGIFLCDVMGHGMRAALVTAIVRGITEELTLVAHKPGEFLTELNRDFNAVFHNTQKGMFATAIYLVADVRTGDLEFACAGHPSPFRMSHRKQTVEPLPLQEGELGPALGLIEKVEYVTCSTSMDLNDVIVLFTDGLCEVARPDREAFGEERLADALLRRMDMPPARIFREVVKEAETFSEGKGFDDDVCLVGMQVAGLGMLGGLDTAQRLPPSD